MSDNHKYDFIEQFFRKKTAEYEIEYRESDWLKLEKNLELRDQQAFHKKKLFWTAVAAALIISLLSYLTLDNHLKINELTQLLQEEPAPEITQIIPEESDVFDTEQPSVPIQPDEGVVEEAPDPGNQLPFISLFNFPVTGEKASDSDQEAGEKRAGFQQALASEMEQVNIEQRKEFTASLGCAGCSLERISALHQTKPRQSFATAIKEISDAPPESQTQTFPVTTSADPQQDLQSSSRSRLSLGFVAGPDLSTTGSVANFTEPGYNLGLKVEYNISRNLSISTGVVQSEVRYQALGDEYTPSDTYFNGGILPSETDAVCNILDIPLTVNYRFLHFENSRLYASAGFSSYIMLNENYQFSYDVDRPDLVQSFNERTGTSHLMSNASISLGYELDLLPNWSLRAEPYLKIPVRGIGWGNVDLYSVGSLLSLNYNL